MQKDNMHHIAVAERHAQLQRSKGLHVGDTSALRCSRKARCRVRLSALVPAF